MRRRKSREGEREVGGGERSWKLLIGPWHNI